MDTPRLSMELQIVPTREPNRSIENLPEKKLASSLRHCLLVWAYLRLVYLIFWSGIVLIGNVQHYYVEHSIILEEYPSLLLFGPVALMIQIVEIAMNLMFIVACHKESAKLIRIYLYYCIVTLILYIILTSLFLMFEIESHHFLVESCVYTDMNVLPPKYDVITFFVLIENIYNCFF